MSKAPCAHCRPDCAKKCAKGLSGNCCDKQAPCADAIHLVRNKPRGTSHASQGKVERRSAIRRFETAPAQAPRRAKPAPSVAPPGQILQTPRTPSAAPPVQTFQVPGTPSAIPLLSRSQTPGMPSEAHPVRLTIDQMQPFHPPAVIQTPQVAQLKLQIMEWINATAYGNAAYNELQLQHNRLVQEQNKMILQHQLHQQLLHQQAQEQEQRVVAQHLHELSETAGHVRVADRLVPFPVLGITPVGQEPPSQELAVTRRRLKRMRSQELAGTPKRVPQENKEEKTQPQKKRKRGEGQGGSKKSRSGPIEADAAAPASGATSGAASAAAVLAMSAEGSVQWAKALHVHTEVACQQSSETQQWQCLACHRTFTKSCNIPAAVCIGLEFIPEQMSKACTLVGMMRKGRSTSGGEIFDGCFKVRQVQSAPKLPHRKKARSSSAPKLPQAMPH
jgi:hypothetical protein